MKPLNSEPRHGVEAQENFQEELVTPDLKW